MRGQSIVVLAYYPEEIVLTPLILARVVNLASL